MTHLTIAGAALIAAAAFTSPALAQKVTVKYTEVGVSEYTVVYDDVAMTATRGKTTSAYTFDAATRTLCEGETCLTFAKWKAEPGASMRFTSTDGRSGVATVMSVKP
jgi:hypothetical protein